MTCPDPYWSPSGSVTAPGQTIGVEGLGFYVSGLAGDDAGDQLAIAGNGKRLAYFRYRQANGNQDNAELVLGTGVASSNADYIHFLSSIRPASISQTGDQEVCGINIANFTLTATDQVTRTGYQNNVELDYLDIRATGGAVQFNKHVTLAVRFAIPREDVTLLSNEGITFGIPNASDVSGAALDYKCIVIPAMTAGGATGFHTGMYFMNEPSGGSISSASGVPIVLHGRGTGSAAGVWLKCNDLPVFKAHAGGATGNWVETFANNTPTIQAGGPGSNVALNLSSKGTWGVSILTGASTKEQVRVSHTANAVNRLDLTGSATGAGVAIAAAGSDTDVSIVLRPQGAGTVVIASLPTSASGLPAGALWNDSGTLKVA